MSKKPMTKETKKIDFIKDYSALQKIVEWFERDDIDLEEGIKHFEEGMRLVKGLKTYLATMEITIKELKQVNE